ncbi:unnamed protein product [Pylaiella littoralis]
MASRFLRADLRRVCRPARSQSSTSTVALSSSAARTREQLPSVSATPSRTNSGTVAAAAAAAHTAPGWHSTSVQPLGRASSTFATVPRCSADTLVRTGVGSRSSSTCGTTSVTPTGALAHGSSWRGATGRGILLWLGQQQAGRRFLSSGRGNARGQTLINKDIKAAQVLLVWETKDGLKETTVVSRQQALDAAKAASLDLVQVSGNNVKVVCRLMDFKKEEMRKQKQQKASVQKPRKKKEMRLRGMIASHDFERKVDDVKKYLERGDVVKVVLEANMSLLKRSGNCLDELQERFEATMDEFEGVVMKPSGGGNGYTRREIECLPKAVKATTAKVATTSAVAEDASPEVAVEPVEKDRPKPPPPRSGVVDEEVVRGILSGTVEEPLFSDDDDDGITASASGEDAPGESSEEDSSSCSSDEKEELESSLEAGAAGEREKGEEEVEGEEALPSLTPGSGGIWDADLFDDLADGAEKEHEEIEWEKYQARRQADRRKQEEARERVRLRDDKRSGRGRSNGSGSRREWDGGDGGDGGGRRAWSADSDGGEERRRKARTSAGRGGGRGGGGGITGRRGGTDGGDRRANAGADTGRHEGGFSGRGRMSPRTHEDFGRGRGVGGSGNDGRRQGGEGRERGGGRGNGGRGWAPPPATPNRPTPIYKWRTSIADRNEAAATGAGAPAQQQLPRQSRSAVATAMAGAAPQDGVGRGTRSDGASGEIRGFRARFGAGIAGNGQQQTIPRRPAGSGPADSADAEEVADSADAEEVLASGIPGTETGRGDS